MKGCIPFQNQKYKLALRLPAHQLRDRLRDMGDDVGSERAVFVALFRRQHPRPAEQVRCRRRAGSALSVRVVDKNHGDTRLAEFGVEFAQENR